MLKQTKICTKCKRELTLDNFDKNKRCKYGVRTICKECRHNERMAEKEQRKLFNKIYHEKNKEELNKKCREYYHKNKKRWIDYVEKNRDEINQKRKIYRENNKEKLSIKWKEWAKNNIEHLRKKQRERYKNPESKEKILMYCSKRRYKIHILPNNYSYEQWEQAKAYFHNTCAYCGQEKPLEREHFIPIDKGGEYTKNNIIPACKNCNCSKNAQDFFKWYPKQEFYSKDRENKILKYLHYNKKNKAQQLALTI